MVFVSPMLLILSVLLSGTLNFSFSSVRSLSWKAEAIIPYMDSPMSMTCSDHICITRKNHFLAESMFEAISTMAEELPGGTFTRSNSLLPQYYK